MAAPDADATSSARHSKTISVGAASALFGDAGSAGDFFSTLSSPFDAIGEEDEGASGDAPTAVADDEPTEPGASSPDWFGSPLVVDAPTAEPVDAQPVRQRASQSS